MLMLVRDEVLKQALTLPPSDQAFIAEAIDENLVAQIVDPVEECEGVSGDSLLTELQRRSAAYRAGLTTARDAADVLADLRRRQANESAQ